MSDDSQKRKSTNTANPFEAFRELGRDAAGQIRQDLLNPLPREIANQLFGRRQENKHAEIMPGESLQMNELWNGRRKEYEEWREKAKISHFLLEEERALVERRGEELAVELHVIKQEMAKIAKSLPELDSEVKRAVIQSRDNEQVSLYEKFFVHKIIAMLRGFAKKIENASVWLSVANRRASNRNAWGQNYKKHGAKYLLSGEHYNARSAG